MHLAVVDPEVGARRRAVALRTAEEDRLLVGPDNGLLLPAAERFGGVVGGGRALGLAAGGWSRSPPPSTAATCSRRSPRAWPPGEPLAEAGAPLDPEELTPVELSRAHDRGRRAGRARGGARTRSATWRSTPATPTWRAPSFAWASRSWCGCETRRASGVYTRTFADVRRGSLLLYEDAGGALALAVNGGDAGALLGLRLGDEVRVEPA